MSDGCFHIGGYEHDEHEPRFDIEREVAKANAAYFAAIPLPPDEIPKSLLRRNQPDYDAHNQEKE